MKLRVALAAILVSAAALAADHDPAFEWNEQGLEAAYRNDHQVAEKLFEQAIARWRSLGKDYEAHLATTLSNLAMSQCAQGRRRECSANLEHAVTLYRRTLGMNSERTLTAVNLLAGVCLMVEDMDRARDLLEEALPVERKYFPRDIQLSRTLGGLAALHTELGQLDAALPLAEEALNLTIELDGGTSVDAALEYANVAEIHRVARRRDRALPLFRKSRSLYEQLLGPDSPRVASLLSQEGLILMEENKLALAEEAMQRARRIMDGSCPHCEFEKSVLLGNLGMLRLRQGRYSEAGDFLARTLSLQEKFSMHPSVNMAGTLSALAEVRKRQKRYDEAARLTSRASSILSFNK